MVQRHRHFAALVERASDLAPIHTAVVAPEEALSLKRALLAAREGIITAILIGDPARVAAAALAFAGDLGRAD